MKSCEKCGHQNSDDTIFCLRCGHMLNYEYKTNDNNKSFSASDTNSNYGALNHSKEPNTSSSSSGSTAGSSRTDSWEVFGKILLTLGVVILIILAAYKWELIGTAIASPMAYYSVKNIWND